MASVKGVGLPSGLTCPSCGAPLNVKLGKNGHFLACTQYPECRFTSDYARNEKGLIEILRQATEEVTDKKCEKCGKPLLQKSGKYGTFLACSGFPDCKYTQSLSQNGSGKPTGVPCPEEGCSGELVEKTSRRGKIFYGCNQYPNCRFAIWDKPVPKPCPQCNAKFLIEKTTKKRGTFLICHNKACGYSEDLNGPEGQ